jgi:ribosome-binding factor A
MSQHTEQIESVLHRAVQEIFSRGLNDPRVRGLLSVTDVAVSSDLADATIKVSVMPAEHAELSLHGIRHAAPHIRTLVGRAVRLRRMPRLSFKLDDSLKKEAQVIAAINDARRRDEALKTADHSAKRAEPPEAEDLAT